jgi:hypothetical protein
MRYVRNVPKPLRPHAYRGDASSRIAIGLALSVVLIVAVYVAWSAMTGHAG